MTTIINAYSLTIDKLEKTVKALEEYIRTDNPVNAQECMKAFLRYEDCFYCQKFRTTFGKGVAGCCNSCPLHKYGIKVTQRDRLYNGCYSIAYYREVVRVARLFTECPTDYMGRLLITKIHECLYNLELHRTEVEN